jgi:hypothetical protein
MDNLTLTEYLDDKKRIKQLEKQVRKLQNENAALRALTGRVRRKSRKNKVLDAYKPGITGAELAKIAGCTVRYANQVKRFIEAG